MKNLLSDLLNEEVIRINIKCTDWKDAIRKGAQMLINKGFIKESYTNSIINNFEKFEAYMVIAPGIVLSHARPEDGVKKMSMSLMTLANPIDFGSEMNDPVKLVITLAAIDSDSHMKIMKKLTELLMNTEDLDKLMKSTKIEDAIQIIDKY